MILYNLRCCDGHDFEAWFKDSAAYDKQSKRGLVECPHCFSSDVAKAPMAPRLSKSSSSLLAEQRAKTVAREILEAMGEMKKQVEENCDYVGDKFADEARAIHYGESDKRGIYGEASKKEVGELIDEEIPVRPLPWSGRKN